MNAWDKFPGFGLKELFRILMCARMIFLKFVDSFSVDFNYLKPPLGMFSPKKNIYLLALFKNIYHSTYLYSKILSEMILLNNDSFTVH